MRVLDKPTSGYILYIDNKIAVLKIPMAGSYAIPLRIIEPKSSDIVAWSFTDFSGQRSSDPSCLIIVSCQHEGEFLNLSSISLCTHIGDRCVNLTSRSVPLSRAETTNLAQAVVFSLSSGNGCYFGALFPILSAGLDSILADCAASAMNMECGNSTDIWLARGIDFVPNCVILRSAAGYTYKPITCVRFHAPSRASITLGAGAMLDASSVNGAILTGHGRYAVARVIGAI